MQRKKAMNIILLLFLILSSALIGASMSVFYSTVTAIDYSIDKSNIADVIQLCNKYGEGDKLLKSLDSQEESLYKVVETEPYVIVKDSDIQTQDGKKEQSGVLMWSWLQKIPTNYNKVFDEMDEALVLEPGEIAIPRFTNERRNMNIGDQIKITIEGKSYTFTIAHLVKDIAFGSEMLGAKRYFLTDQDYEQIVQEVGASNKGEVLNFKVKEGTTSEELVQQITDLDYSVTQGFNFTKNLVGFEYVSNMLVAGIIMVVSIILIAIAFMILRFTIVFTLQEEYKEIGIMKAIGLKERPIRRIYLVKYLFLSVIGGVIGFFISIPLSVVMLGSLKNYLLLGDDHLKILLSLFGVCLVILLTILFCYRCTKKIRKFSVMVAIRQGSTGERFHSIKHFPNLQKTRLKIPVFLGISDLFANGKRFVVMMITFILGTTIMIIPINAANTLKSNNMIEMLGLAQMDCYIKIESFDGETESVDDYVENLRGEFEEVVPGIDVWADYGVTAKLMNLNQDRSKNIAGYRSIGKGAEAYSYLEGEAPKLANEIAVTKQVAAYLNVGLGDVIFLEVNGEKAEYVVTALYQTVMNMGDGFRLSNQAEITMPDEQSFLWACKFPNTKDTKDNIDKLQKAFPEMEFHTTQKFLSSMLGSFLDSVDDMIHLLMAIVAGVVFMITCLLLKMLLTKEVPEVAILKSLGFKNASIRLWQLSRILIILLLSIALGTVISNTVGNALVGLVFKFAGAEKVLIMTKPLQVYIGIPIFLLSVTTLAAVCSMGQIKKIKIWEINNQE